MKSKINYNFYHWNNLDKLQKDEIKIYKYYLNIANKVYEYLNEFHSEKNSKRYWEILVGPWLFQFIQFYFDKFQISKTYIYKKKNKKTPSIDPLESYNECYKFYINDNYIEASLNEIKDFKEKREIKNVASKKKVVSVKKIINGKKRSFLNKNSKKIYFLFKKKILKNKVININLPLKASELNNISDKYNRLDNLLNSYTDTLLIKNSNINKMRYLKLKHKVGDDVFTKFIKSIVLLKMPKEYVEYYKQYSEFYRNQLSDIKCDIVLVRSPVENNTKIRYQLSIFHEDLRSKIFAFQEGGIGKFSHQTNYEKQQLIGCDKFFQWSNLKKQRQTINFFLVKTYWIKKYEVNKNNKILLVLGSFRKHFFSLYEGHMPGYSNRHIELVSNFLDQFNEKEQKNISIKGHKDFGFGERELFIYKFPAIRFYNNKLKNINFYNLLDKYELKIFTSDYTSNIQSFLINHPSIMLIDKNKLPYNPIYKNEYKNLIDANIYFSDPIKCYHHVCKILNNGISNWWFSKEVQYAKDKYLDRICRVSNNLENEIRTALDKKL